MGDYGTIPNPKTNVQTTVHAPLSTASVNPVAQDVNNSSKTTAEDITGLGAAVSGQSIIDKFKEGIAK